MPKPTSPNTIGQNDSDAVPPAGLEPGHNDANLQALPPKQPADSSSPKSLWGKAKGAISDVSAQASSARSIIASKAVTLGASGAAKSAEIGKKTYATAGDATRGALAAGKQAYSGSKLESAVNYVDSELEQRGAKQAIKGTAEAVVGKIDEVTGKRLIELLERKLESQDAYNDILATRLAEALERIARLEGELTKLIPAAATPAQRPDSELNTGSTRSRP